MEYLRNLGTAAASSLLAKSGITLPFSLGNKVAYLEGRSIWTLYDAIKRDDSSPVSVFFFDASVSNRRNLLPLAKNALRKLRTIRHPDVLKFIDVVETDTTIYIVTERVQPLGAALSTWSSKPAAAREEWLVWGLQRIAVALTFVNDTCQSTHGNVRVDSVFISQSGEWRLGGFELLSNPKDDASVLYTLGSLMPDLMPFSPPEVKASGWSSTKEQDVAATDAYEFGLFLHSIFNPSHPLPPTSIPPHPAPTAASRGAIPVTIFPTFRKLLMPKPKPRLSTKTFLEIGNGEKPGEGSGFISQNRLVKLCASLEGFNLSSETEKASFLRTLKDSSGSFPPEFTSYKVLPTLVSALEFGGASASTILPLVLQLGSSVPPEDHPQMVLGPVVKLFSSADRGTRMALLDHLPEFAEKLDQRTVSDKIWPHLQTGFGDTVAVIREATVRSISLLSPKLSDRIINNELLKHLAKSQLDPEPSIRTNTCILIGRLAPNLSSTTQRKVLIPAFSRALKDGFVHARVAGLMALMATMALYDVDDLAGKVIPAMSFTIIDKEKLVRDQAIKAIELFIKKLEAHAATMPETAIPPGMPSEGAGATPYAASTQASIVNSATGAAGALAGWAMSSLGKQLATSDLQSQIAELPVRPSPSPAVNGAAPARSAPAVPTATRPAPTPASGPTKAKALQLGASKQPHGRSSLGAELEKEAAVELGEWDDDADLMDVHADADDWTAFQSGPPPLELDDAWGDNLDQESVEPSPDLPNRALSPTPSVRSAASPPPLFAGLARGAPAARLVVPPQRPAVSAPSSPAPPHPPQPAAQPRPSPPALSRPPAPSTVPGGWDDFDDSMPASPSASSTTHVAGGMAGMSKEEKAAEMARRREERKQRIAALKEQKKAGGK